MRQATHGSETLKQHWVLALEKLMWDCGRWENPHRPQSQRQRKPTPPSSSPAQTPCICTSSLVGGHFPGTSVSLVLRDRARSSAPGLRACLEAREARKFISLLRA